MKKPLNERIEEAKLSELMPGFDKDVEWSQLAAKLHPAKTKPFLPTWLRAAAVLLLLAASGTLVWYFTQNNTISALSRVDDESRNEWASFALPPAPSPITAVTDAITATADPTNDGDTKSGIPTNKTASTAKNKNEYVNNYTRTGEFVCNGTACPIEICIIQTIKCKNERPSAIATCSIIEPDQAHQLHYKAADDAGDHCKVTIDEIRIRRVNTGETIVLNSHSEPSTAEELFNCLTGETKCNLLAGIFNKDCNNQKRTNSLKIGNDHGNLIVQ